MQVFDQLTGLVQKRPQSNLKQRQKMIMIKKITIRNSLPEEINSETRPTTAKTLNSIKKQRTGSKYSMSSRPETALNTRPTTGFETRGKSSLDKIFDRQKEIEKSVKGSEEVNEKFKRKKTVVKITKIPIYDLLFENETQDQREILVTLAPIQSQRISTNTRDLGALFASKPKMFLVINGWVMTDSQSFEIFTQETKISLSILNYFLYHLQKFCFEYAIIYGECSFVKIYEFLNSSTLNWKFLDRESLIDIFINLEDVRKQVSEVARRFKGKKVKNLAALKIQATWKKFLARREYEHYKFKKRCAKTIVQYFRMRIKRKKRIGAIEAEIDIACEQLRISKSDFGDRWKRDFEGKEHTIVMINSLSFVYNIRQSIEIEQEERNFYGRLCQLLDKNVSVIYLTPELSPELRAKIKRLLNVNLNYDQLITSKRLTIIEIPKLPYFSKATALDSVLLVDPFNLTRINHMLTRKKAYLEPLVASREQAKICSLFKLPMYGCIEFVKTYCHNKAAQKEFLKNFGVNLVPGIIILPKSKPLELEELIEIFKLETGLNPPSIIIKINEHNSNLGLAIVNMDHDLESLSDRLKILNPKLNSRDFLKSLFKFGGILEFYFTDSQVLDFFSVHIDLTPNQKSTVVGSNSSFFDKSLNLKSICCPSKSFEKSNQIVDIFCKKMIEESYFGHLSVEFVSTNEGIYVLGFKTFYTFERHQIDIFKLQTRDMGLKCSNLRHFPAPESFPVYQYLKKLHFFDLEAVKEQTNPKIREMKAICFFGVRHSGILHLSEFTIDSLCVQNGIIMNPNGTGVSLVRNNEDMTISAINDSFEQCAESLLHSMLVFRRKIEATQGHDNFVEYAALGYSIALNNKHIRTVFQTLEEFARSYLKDKQKLVLDQYQSQEEDKKSITPQKGMGTEAVWLINCELPSQNLILFDSNYGKTTVIKPTTRLSKIPPRNLSTEQYLEMMETQANEYLKNRGLGSKKKTFKK